MIRLLALAVLLALVGLALVGRELIQPAPNAARSQIVVVEPRMQAPAMARLRALPCDALTGRSAASSSAEPALAAIPPASRRRLRSARSLAELTSQPDASSRFASPGTMTTWALW